MAYFKNKNNIENANILSETKNVKFEKGKYPADFLKKIHSVTGANYGSDLINKSKYTVKGSLIGLFAGVAIAMYFKKRIIIGAVGGVVVGTFVAYGIQSLSKKKAIILT